jgi:hypothetical protein
LVKFTKIVSAITQIFAPLRADRNESAVLSMSIRDAAAATFG